MESRHKLAKESELLLPEGDKEEVVKAGAAQKGYKNYMRIVE